jgi:phospholipase/carboxylesterase
VVIGFSQGAAMTFALGLRDSTRPRPAAIAGLSGSIPEPPWLEYAWTASDLPPTYVQHGLDDHVVPIDRARHTRQVLERHHLELEYHEYNMQHEINAPSLTDVRLWLEQH